MSGRRRGRERGFALLLVLWTLVPASLVATRIVAAGRGEAQLAANLRGAAELEAAADGAVHEAAFRMLDPSPAGWRADGGLRSLPLLAARAVASIRLEDQAGLVNPNAAQPALLAAMLRRLGSDTQRAEATAAAIADWRSPSTQSRSGLDRAQAYRAAGLGYVPPGTSFRSVAELGAVLGMTPPLLRGLAPYLSVYTEGDPDPGLADPLVLEAMREVAGTRNLAPLTRTGPRVVLVTATASRPDGDTFTRRALLRIGAGSSGRPYEILEWLGAGR